MSIYQFYWPSGRGVSDSLLVFMSRVHAPNILRLILGNN